MDRRNKLIKMILWTLVILFILLFVVILIVEHSLSRNVTSALLEYSETIEVIRMN